MDGRACCRGFLAATVCLVIIAGTPHSTEPASPRAPVYGPVYGPVARLPAADEDLLVPVQPKAKEPEAERRPATDKSDDDLLAPAPHAPHSVKPKVEGAGQDLGGQKLPTGEDPHAACFATSDYPSAETCAQCHKQIYDEWRVSSHAYRLSVRMRSPAETIYFMRFCKATPEMELAMNENILDVHAYSVEFDVR